MALQTKKQTLGRRGTLFTITLLLVGTSFIAQAASTVTASGTFTGKSDHVTTGGVTILETSNGYAVVLEADFTLDGAPDPKIGFGNDGVFAPETLFSPLRKKNGLQAYELPASVDPTAFNEIYIWCEKFSVPLGVASLK